MYAQVSLISTNANVFCTIIPEVNEPNNAHINNIFYFWYSAHKILLLPTINITVIDSTELLLWRSMLPKIQTWGYGV
jgi:hypothetical protein